MRDTVASHPSVSAASRHIVAVTPVDKPGGAETTLVRLLRGLSSRGWEVTLTTPGCGALRRTARSAGWGWRRLPLGSLNSRGGGRAVTSWPRAVSLARTCDVLYLNGGVAGRLLPAVSCLSGGAATVLHVHDIVERVPGFWRRTDLVLADSAAAAARLAGLSPHVVYCPVDPDPPAAEPPWLPGPGPVVGFVGRLEPRKAPLDLIAAAPELRRHLCGVRIVMIGDEPYGSDPAYTRRVLSAPGVEHIGWQENAAGLMRHLDVLVLPARQEPFGTVLAEAMAVGTPVVATRVGGLAEVVLDGVTGRLVAPGEPSALAAAILDVLANRATMGRAAREHAQRFHTGPYVERVERLLEGVLAVPRQTGVAAGVAGR